MMSTTCGQIRFAPRIGVGVVVMAFALAWPSSSPARGQCVPQELSKLIASDAAFADYFGGSVAMSGNTAVVGAYFDDHPGATDAGSAYVFVPAGAAWTQQAKLTASDAAANDNFGNSVAVSGDTAVVGAWMDDLPGKTDAGSAYVFVRSGTVWTQQQKLTASDASTFDLFGASVAVSGDTALIGAPSGSAYVFVRSGTVWTQRPPLVSSDRAGDDQFGESVALSGNTAVVGSNFDDNAGGADVGAAYIFTPTGNVWLQRAKLTASDPSMNASFGGDVAVDGDRVVIGAIYDSNTSAAFAGTAYVFDKPVAGWSNMTETHKLIASDAAMNDLFGTVAVSGDTVLVGARQDTHAAGQYAGSAYIFDLACEIDTDGDGVLDADDVCPNNVTGLPVDCTGRPLRDANNDCLVDPADVPIIVNELLSLTVPPTGCNGLPLRDTNGDAAVNGADLQLIVDELL